ncbi:8-amino-7-oxononanoate synthase [Chondrocystis sp. NIES-4102]|nr:8-amino-7-oxononanoate synthase [Chondrocystis sp. NIES-4102]
MGIEKKLSRAMFDPSEVVELRQVCFTPGQVFSPGKYIVEELPDVAFTMGLVDKLSPIQGQKGQITPEQSS